MVVFQRLLRKSLKKMTHMWLYNIWLKIVFKMLDTKLNQVLSAESDLQPLDDFKHLQILRQRLQNKLNQKFIPQIPPESRV